MTDEAHLKQRSTTSLITTFKGSPQARKWFVTGTLFESFADQLPRWISTLQTHRWSVYNPDATEPPWPRRDEYQQTLLLCTSAALKALGYTCKQLIDYKVDLTPPKTLDHVSKLSVVLKTLYLKRSATEFLSKALLR